MIGSTISHYKILDELGRGGMGIVYKAHDTKLDRMVALKFLPAHLSTSEQDKARFIQEAKAASALNHPNVCHINAIGEHEGQQFIDMEFVDGLTLRKKLAAGSLQVETAVTYAIQIGDALHEAHSKGIVHRDVKCENVMINSKNQIKVMDFGLAKLKGSLKLTRTSSTVGTLAYMAPEQIQGGEVDARSDIFSFGIVLFEMLTGRLPFRGEHEAAMVYSIVNEEPEPIKKYFPDASPELVHILSKALEKSSEDRYQSVSEMVVDLRRVKKESTKVSRVSVERQIVSTVREKGPATLMEERSTEPVGIFKRHRKALTVISGMTIVGIVIVAVLFFRNFIPSSTEQRTERKMLVVLPFENLGSPEQEYFADGITEEITSRLSGLSGLGVIARSSARQYKKTEKTIKQIGEELGVTYILEGTVRWEVTADGTKRVRVNPQLIKVADGTQVWSQPSEAVLSDVFKLQSEIATQVATALDVALLQPERKALEAKPTNNPEAYDAYLRGKDYLHRGFEEKDTRIAEEMFQKAVRLDPNFALGYAQLSRSHAFLYWLHYDRTEERVLKAKEAAEKALQLAPDLSDAHAAMGYYYYHGRLDYDNALREFDIANKLQANNVDVVSGIAFVRRRQGKMEDAITNLLKAVDLDPRASDLPFNLAETYVLVRNYSEGERYFDRSLSLVPDQPIVYVGKAWLYLLWEGNTVKSRRVLEEAVQKIGGIQDPSIIYLWVTLDMVDQKYEDALRKLSASSAKSFENQFSFVPREIIFAEIYGLMHQVQQERAYYDSAKIRMEELVRTHPEDSRFHSALGIVYAGLGRKQDAIREGKLAVEQLPISKEAWRGAYRVADIARIYTMVGEHDAAVQQLELLLSIPSWFSKPWLRIDPTWIPLRNNPRFQKLVL